MELGKKVKEKRIYVGIREKSRRLYYPEKAEWAGKEERSQERSQEHNQSVDYLAEQRKRNCKGDVLEQLGKCASN